MKGILQVLALAVCSACAAFGAQRDPVSDVPAAIPAPGAIFAVKTASRTTTCLNGKWSFQPADNRLGLPPAEGWARISVPGIWNKPWQTAVTPGERPALNDDQLQKSAYGWFQRSVHIPAEAEGKKVLLDFRDISGSGKVFVNGVQVGTITQWGTADVTRAIEPGRSCLLSVLVAATSASRNAQTVFGGPAVQDSAPLEDRGILGDVFLTVLPRDAVIDRVAIRTSVRDANWRITADLGGLTGAARYTLRVQAREANGTVASEMETTLAAQTAEQQVSAETSWRGARRWDLDDPYLYECVIRLFDERGALLDEYRDSFGFREFGIAKESFILNGRKVRLRPRLFTGAWEHTPTFCPPLIRAQLRGIKADGFNTVQYWPDAFHPELEHIAAEADRLGVLLILPLESMTELAGDFREQGHVDPEWREKVRKQIGLIGNHPSIVMWGVSPNVFGTALPPFFVPGAPIEYAYLTGIREGARIALAAYKEMDPTRPVFFHASDVGDVSAPNLYLNMMPLQEQREFLGIWASEKAYPLMAIECGLPISEALMRFRRPGFDAWRSAPFATEAAAIYLGEEAYALERDAYVRRIEAQFRGNEVYSTWQYPDPPNQEENFNRVSALFVKERWRAWRAWGITGGMLPWEYEDLSYVMGTNSFTPADDTMVEVGARSVPGCWPDRVFRGELVPWTVGRSNATTKFARAWRPVGRAFQEANQPLLVYIGGSGGARTDQRHTFYSREVMSRDIIAIYDGDSPEAARLALRWQVRVGPKTVLSSEKTILIPCGEDVHVPIRVMLPELSQRTEGAIVLYADDRLVDSYVFTAFPPATMPKLKREPIVLDPVGLTTKMLRGLGVPVKPLAGKPSPSSLLMIGREALSGDSASQLRPGGRGSSGSERDSVLAVRKLLGGAYGLADLLARIAQILALPGR